ncbi:alpha/beta hydrolase [Rhodanobacter sp. DHG33]|uniref:alpha/beta fold hydrolase n=1 Tax=Rhodanobacter sp. DHG33 TaxID=2775921 RepID=UPI00177ECC81|nr:alpha/beta hydrolase [Rhodanobacter sp. DHG33]MBD8900178.1 alpha/beta hydrolase [Rhodanobacter sp. DHG33]
MKKPLLVMLIGLAVGLPLSAPGVEAEKPGMPSNDIPATAYEHAQTLVALPDGRRLNLFCMGKGTPTIFFEAGGGDDSLAFRRVQGRLASVTRVCSYDRAGMGFSDPSDAPTTATHIVGDLHALIRSADIPLPIILVGHSDGGLYATFYAANYPNDVAGLVLIDPDSPGLNRAATSVLDQPWLDGWRKGNQDDIKQARLCFDLAQHGELARDPVHNPKCLDDPSNADPALHRLLNAQLARPSEQEAMLTEDLDTYPAPDGGLSKAEVAFQRMHFSFGDKPLVVLSGTSELGALPTKERVKVSKAMLANQAALAAHSTQGRQILVNSGTEYIQISHPEAVVQAVKGVIGEVRGRMAGR